MNDFEINELKDLFLSLDKDNDGVLTVKEIRDGLRESQFQNTLDIEKVFSSVNTDQSGTINYTEFLAASLEQRHYLKEEKLKAAFRLFDRNNDGFISAE